MDNACISFNEDRIRYSQQRHIGCLYVPRKGKSQTKYTDNNKSSLGPIFNMTGPINTTVTPTKCKQSCNHMYDQAPKAP